jgi:hypothetical protein
MKNLDMSPESNTKLPNLKWLMQTNYNFF